MPHEAECPCEFCEIFRLRARIAELEEWKSSALDILNGINLQEVGKALSVGLGQPIGPAILPGIHSLRARVAELEVDTTRRLGSRVNVLEDALEEIKRLMEETHGENARFHFPYGIVCDALLK